MRPNHHQFIAFSYVVREGSFSAAARRLGVTQSTVTQHVSKLEELVGSELLLRRRDGVSLTPTGRDFFGLADRLVALDCEIGERLRGYSSLNEGRLKVIANAPQPALQVIATFNDRFPNVHIDFRLCDWTTANQLIRDRVADVGLITDASERDDWERVVLQETRYVLYCRSDHALADRDIVGIEDLMDQTIILPEQGSLTQQVVHQKLAERQMELPQLITMTTFPVMCEAVRQGLGAAIFLKNSSHIYDGLVEIPIRDFHQIHQTCFVAPKDRARLKLINEFRAAALAITFQ
ncbi:transcriptional regulator, LysR family [Thalassococcus halodurans]|uniref:Transcriptional regulator, LysR family n=1 Tax=Thalassococcus halodurans TaxID=373675 RepID=A0A1H6B2S6_9RHOB|nr:LysR family transcriptional regulator [Thalassococcus halodurans]MEE2810972.1 LysR family transcriptional regulator [Pseudomonadota bacterium]SEG54527.1 transcriptional regulator, LysR family [Thalassococcus halodurans]